MSSNSAKAVVLQVVGGQLVGATGVNVGGTLYDVTFGNGTCDALFSGCDNPAADCAFTAQADAVLAAQALLDQVFLDGRLGNFDTQPILTNGCDDAFQCLAHIPWNVESNLAISEYALNHFVEAADLANPTATGPNKTLPLTSEKTRAIFTPAVIPIPPALLLFLSGLVAFFGVARVGRRGVKAEA